MRTVDRLSTLWVGPNQSPRHLSNNEVDRPNDNEAVQKESIQLFLTGFTKRLSLTIFWRLYAFGHSPG